MPLVDRVLQSAIARVRAYLKREEYSDEYEHPRQFEAIKARGPEHPVHRAIRRVEEHCFRGNPLPDALRSLWKSFLASTRQECPASLSGKRDLEFWRAREAAIQESGAVFLRALRALAARRAARRAAGHAAREAAGETARGAAREAARGADGRMCESASADAEPNWSRPVYLSLVRNSLGISSDAAKTRLIASDRAEPGRVRMRRPTPNARKVQVALSDLPKKSLDLLRPYI